MEIQTRDNNSKGAFYIEKDGKDIALMTFSWAGDDKFIIDHTEVDESLKGQGIGGKLVETAVEYARKKDVKIIPLCPFAKKVMQKESSYQDVLH